jgi:hypothetical protein
MQEKSYSNVLSVYKLIATTKEVPSAKPNLSSVPSKCQHLRSVYEQILPKPFVFHRILDDYGNSVLIIGPAESIHLCRQTTRSVRITAHAAQSFQRIPRWLMAAPYTVFCQTSFTRTDEANTID